jgi:hypothetical protein
VNSCCSRTPAKSNKKKAGVEPATVAPAARLAWTLRLVTSHWLSHWPACQYSKLQAIPWHSVSFSATSRDLGLFAASFSSWCRLRRSRLNTPCNPSSPPPPKKRPWRNSRATPCNPSSYGRATILANCAARYYWGNILLEQNQSDSNAGLAADDKQGRVPHAPLTPWTLPQDTVVEAAATLPTQTC